jgi:hypothetical protein
MKMQQQLDVHIDGTDYKITQFLATKGLGIEVKLMKLLGPSFMELQKASQDENAQEAVLTAAISALIEQFDKVDVVSLVKELLSGVTKGTQTLNFDQEFAGRYGVIFDLVKEVLKFNFSDVFSKLGLGIGA